MDAVILEEVLGYIHNWFVRDTMQVSDCTISDHSLPDGIGIPVGVWYRIQGSYLNDGMHLRGATDEGLSDETFSGTITTHVIPRPLLSVCDEISGWNAKYGAAAHSPYQSESFGGYSYSKASGSSASSSGVPQSGWRAAFAGRLTRWRKLA